MQRRIFVVALALALAAAAWMAAPAGYRAGTATASELPPPPVNDDISAAISIAPVYAGGADLTSATTEPDEPTQCEYYFPPATQTAWYQFAPSANRLVRLTQGLNGDFSEGSAGVVNVYRRTGAGFGGLELITCRVFDWWDVPVLQFYALQGDTYFIQYGILEGFAGFGVGVYFTLADAPPPIPEMYFYPDQPSIYDTVQFYGYAYSDWVPITGWRWDFGDGTVGWGQWTTHRYAADGDYTVTLAIQTEDNRYGETSRTIHVETRDVGIRRFAVPKSAQVGQQKTVIVGVSNYTKPAYVRVTLARIDARGNWAQVGVLRQWLPSTGRNRSVDFAFNYTFTPDDAALGKVSFAAGVEIIPTLDAGYETLSDALPGDNYAQSLPVTVSAVGKAPKTADADDAMQEGFVYVGGMHAQHLPLIAR